MGFKDKFKGKKVPKKEKEVVEEPLANPDVPLNKQREFRA